MKLKKHKKIRYQCSGCGRIVSEGEIVIESQFTPICIYCKNEELKT